MKAKILQVLREADGYVSGQQLCEQFQKHRKVLTRELIEKFAEILPYKTSYDKNMFKITMQDGNIVYTNLKSIKMLSKYQSVLTKMNLLKQLSDPRIFKL